MDYRFQVGKVGDDHGECFLVFVDCLHQMLLILYLLILLKTNRFLHLFQLDSWALKVLNDKSPLLWILEVQLLKAAFFLAVATLELLSLRVGCLYLFYYCFYWRKLRKIFDWMCFYLLGCGSVRRTSKNNHKRTVLPSLKINVNFNQRKMITITDITCL